MLKLSDVSSGIEGILKIDNPATGEPIEIPYKHKLITGELQRHIANKIVEVRHEMNQSIKKAEKEGNLSTYIPIDITIFQLTMVLESLDIDVNGSGKGVDVTSYDALAKVPLIFLEQLFNDLLGDLLPKKKTSTTSETGTSPTEEEEVPQKG